MTEGPSPSQDQQRIVAESGSSVFAVLHGNMHIRDGQPVYRFEPFDPPSLADPIGPRPLDDLPVGLVSPPVDHAEELAQLKAWRGDPTLNVSVSMLCGAVEHNLSQLAAHFAVDSVSLGWTVWAARHRADSHEELVAVPGETSALLVVGEHAERWSIDDLQLMLQSPLLRRPGRTRALLVSRSAENWWPALRHRLGKAGIAVACTIALPPSTDTTLD